MKSVEQQKYWNPVIETLLRERLMDIELYILFRILIIIFVTLMFYSGRILSATMS